MGTRNLTMVISKGEPKIAQYGQWDGYPEGQGAIALEFLKKADLSKFKEKLQKVRFRNDDDEKIINDFLKTIGSEDGWLTSEQSKKYNEKFPYLTRDHGADILQIIMNAPDDADLMLSDQTLFGADPLFCEWAYVINLDTNQLEVYGWANPKAKFENTFEKLYKKEAYLTALKEDEDYKEGRVVSRVMNFDFDNLPTEKKFIKICDCPED